MFDKFWVISANQVGQWVKRQEGKGRRYHDLDVDFSGKVEDVQGMCVWIRQVVDHRGSQGSSDHIIMAMECAGPSLRQVACRLNTQVVYEVLR